MKETIKLELTVCIEYAEKSLRHQAIETAKDNALSVSTSGGFASSRPIKCVLIKKKPSNESTR